MGKHSFLYKKFEKSFAEFRCRGSGKEPDNFFTGFAGEKILLGLRVTRAFALVAGQAAILSLLEWG